MDTVELYNYFGSPSIRNLYASQLTLCNSVLLCDH